MNRFFHYICFNKLVWVLSAILRLECLSVQDDGHSGGDVNRHLRYADLAGPQPINVPRDVKYKFYKSCPLFGRMSNYYNPVSKECNSGSNLTLTWNKIKGAQFYIVFMSKNTYRYCHMFNVTKAKLADFPGQPDQEYIYSVTANADVEGNDTFSSLERIGSCPFRGEWSSWSSWGDCSCKSDSYGSRFRQRHCVRDQILLSDFRCGGSIGNSKSKNCLCRTKEKKSTEPTEANTTNAPNFTLQMNESKNPDRGMMTGMNLGSVLGGVLGAFVVIVIIIVVTRKKRANRPVCMNESEIESTSVYISYATEPQKEKKILSLIHYIASFGVQCTIDLLCQVDINNMGGLPNWLPSNLSNADKILVILSKTYIKALNSIEDGLELVPDKVCKVHTEFNLIKTIMYHSCQRTPQLVIVLDGVKKDEIPDVFRGRHHCSYPKKFEMDDDSCRNLIGLILDTEPLRIETSYDIQVCLNGIE